MAPYRHFADKDALLAAVAEQGFEALAAAMEAATGDEPQPLERLRAFGRSYTAFATWSIVHGLSLLLLDGQVGPALADGDAAQLVERVLSVHGRVFVRRGPTSRDGA